MQTQDELLKSLKSSTCYQKTEEMLLEEEQNEINAIIMDTLSMTKSPSTTPYNGQSPAPFSPFFVAGTDNKKRRVFERLGHPDQFPRARELKENLENKFDNAFK